MRGFLQPSALDGSLKGVSGRHAACGWAVVQLANDKEEEPWYAIHGTMMAFGMQRTIKRAELKAFIVRITTFTILGSFFESPITVRIQNCESTARPLRDHTSLSQCHVDTLRHKCRIATKSCLEQLFVFVLRKISYLFTVFYASFLFIFGLPALSFFRLHHTFGSTWSLIM